LLLAGNFAGAAGTTGGAGKTGAALTGDDFDTGFDCGITLDGADETGRSKMLPVTRRADASARKIDVAKKIAASVQVVLLSALPAPLAPNTVWLEPPNTAPMSAPFPCCNKIVTHSATHTIT
jgi:hypothetical protein